MITINSSKKFKGSYRLYDCLMEETKETLLEWTRMLGLKVPSKLKKAEYAACLEEQILAHPEKWLIRFSRYELELMQQLVRAGENGSVSDIMPPILLDALNMCLIDLKMTGNLDLLWHYIMPNDLRKAIAPHIDRILSDPVNQMYFDLLQYAAGVLMLYGAIPHKFFFKLLDKYMNEHHYDKGTVMCLCLMLSESVILQCADTEYVTKKNVTSDYFVNPLLELDLDKLINDLNHRKKMDYKLFSTAEYMAAGDMPLQIIPCEGYRQAMDYLSTFYENKSICQYMLSYIWSNAQQNVPLQNLIEIFIPDSVPDSKTDKGLSVCQKYLNTLPRWYLKGHSPEETVRLFPRTTPPQLKLGPNLTAQGFEINPEFQEHVNKHWNEPDNLFEGTPFIQTGPKVGRNDPCPCGSGKKYKHCCGK